MSIYDNLSTGTDFLAQRHQAAKNMETLRAHGKLPIHSEFWLPNVGRYKMDYSDPSVRISPEYILQLSKIRRAVANFVKIVTGKDIPVHFSTGHMSYARDTQESIVLSATSDPHKLDIQVGLALHEANHLIRSRVTPGVSDSIPLFLLLDLLRDKNNVFTTPAMEPDIQRLGLADETVTVFLKTILNLMEDIRIDKAAYEQAPGYRAYYDATYAFYWYKPRVMELMADPKSRLPTLRNYRFHIINMTHPEFDETSLPGLTKIVKLIDVPNIGRFGKDKKWNTLQKAHFPEIRVIKDKVSGKSSQVVTGRQVFSLNAMPDMLNVALSILAIVLAHSETDVQIKKKYLNLPPVQVKGKGLDEEDEDGDDDERPIAPAFDPENLDLGTAENKDKDSAGDDSDDTEEDDDTEDDDADSDDSDEDGTEDKAGASAAAPESVPVDQKATPAQAKAFDKFSQEVDELTEEQGQFLDGQTEKEELDETQKQTLDTLEAADASMEVVNVNPDIGDVRVIVYPKLTEALLGADTFPFAHSAGGVPIANPMCQDAVDVGIGMGNMLAHKLRIMSDESPLTYTRQNSGKIDKRLLAGLGYEYESVFQQTFTEKFAPVFVHLTIDSSNSMKGKKFYNSISLAVALAQAASKITNLDVVISLRTHDELPQVLIAYDSRVDSMTKIKTLFQYLRTNGGTPEGVVFAAIKEQIMLRSKPGVKKYFIVLSDGFPSFRHKQADEVLDGEVYERWITYEDRPAWEHTARQVQDMRDAGVTVLAYYIQDKNFKYANGTSKEGFAIMYGRSAAYIDPKSVLEIASSLNKMFLNK